MELFEGILHKDYSDIINQHKINILPYDGEVYYYGRILDSFTAEEYYNRLFDNIEWKHDEVVIFGKHIVTARKVAWYGDKHFEYQYSNVTKKALLWTNELKELKEIVEQTTNETFNSCLLNLYHNGKEGMSWHSDGEKYLKKEGAIASLSLGVNRKFSFKHNLTKQTVSLQLENGSLLIMKGKTQSFWQHSLPKSTKINSPRINLTFRTIV